MSEQVDGAVLVVGVQPGRVEGVVEVAARLAARLRGRLVCVTVDPSLLSSGVRSDGSEIIESVDPDAAEVVQRALPGADAALIKVIADRYGIVAQVLTAVGDPARAIAEVAAEHEASMIVVGTQSGRRRVAEFFNGSVAARLSHQQHRPVLVVPIEPVGFDAPLPWDES